jgi:ABC-2 type transport system permease protein
MRTVRLLLQEEAARWKNRKNIAFLVVLIIFMIGTICYVKEQKQEEPENGKIVLGVANEDTSAYAELLLEYFNENEDFLKYVDLIEDSRDNLQKQMEENRLDAYLIVPKNFAQSMLDMDNLPIQAAVSMKNPTKALVMRHIMEAYETYIEAVEVNCTALYRRMREAGFSAEERDAANVEISLELIFTALGKDDFFRRQIVSRQEIKEQMSIPLAKHYQYTAVYFTLLFLFLPAGLRILSLRKSGMLHRLQTVHMRAGGVLTAVGLPYLLVSVGALALVCNRLSGMAVLPEAMLLLCPWLVVFLLLGLFCKNSEQYLFLCSMIVVCMAVFGGSLIPEAYLPDEFQEIARWMPNRNFTFVMGGVTPW